MACIALTGHNGNFLKQRFTREEMIEESEDYINSYLKDQPMVEAQVRRVFASTYTMLGDFKKVETQVRRLKELEKGKAK